MELGKINNFGNLLSAFRLADRDGDGFIDSNEDSSVGQLDRDGDKRTSLWELMEGVNNQQKRNVFSKSQIKIVKDSISGMPSISPSNIVLILFAIERERVSQKDIARAYSLFNSIVSRMKKEDFSGLTPTDKLKRVSDILDKEFNLRLIRNNRVDSFSLELSKRKLHNNTKAWLIYFIGRELNWPVHLVSVPQHYIIRWVEGANSYNYGPRPKLKDVIAKNSREWDVLEKAGHIDDQGEFRLQFDGNKGGFSLPGYDADQAQNLFDILSFSDNGYKYTCDIPDESIAQGVYLVNLSEVQVLGAFYTNLALSYRTNPACRGYSDAECRYDNEVINASKKALALNPQDVLALTSRVMDPGDYWHFDIDYRDAAIKDLKEVLRLDPKNLWAYFRLASIYASTVLRCDLASQYLSKGVKIYENNKQLHRPSRTADITDYVSDVHLEWCKWARGAAGLDKKQKISR